MLKRISLALLLLAFINITKSNAQTCSCAGAPLISSQTTGASSAGNLLLGITYEYHDISALYSGSTRLVDETVTRSTQSVLFEINYGFTDRLSLSGTFSYVEKDRTTGLQTPSGGTTVNTNGLGDGVFMLRYTIHQQTIWNQYHVAIGAGGKAPLGTTSLQRNGFSMNADMQPGTGSWDGVLWSYFSTSFLPYTTLNLFLNTSYQRTGANDRFADGDSYMFGNALVSSLGITNDLMGNLSYLISLRYRSTTSDQLNGNNMPNTGGRWLSIDPSLNVPVSDTISARISGRIPVYQNLNGTQPTTSYAISGSFFFNFNSSKNDNFNYGRPN
ncbi:hypothetical protein BH23BAC3_BH23BAC3_30700 [soil metagenome]